MKTPRKPASMGHHIQITLQRYLIRGVAVVVPAGITVYAVMFCYRITAAHLTPFLRRFLVNIPDWLVPILAMSLFLGGIFLLGSLATVAVGRRLIEVFEWLLRKIPVIKSIYGATRQLIQIISPSDDAAPKYQSVVLVPFPHEGNYAIGLVTGTIRLQHDVPHYKVFVVTTPNPTSGYLCFYRPEQTRPLQFSVDQVLESVTSGGVLFPENLSAAARPALPEADTPEKTEKHHAETAAPPTKRGRGFFKTRFVSGIFLIVPLVVTVMVLEFLFDLTVGKVKPFISMLPFAVPVWAQSIVAALLLLAVLWMVGAVFSLFIFKKLLQGIEAAVLRVPLIAEIYKVSKQVVDVLAEERDTETARKMPVLVDFPSPGVKGLGFVTGVSKDEQGPLVRIFYPTTPNISVGILILARPQDIQRCLLSAEDALRLLLSVGVLAPESLPTEPFPAEFLE